MKDLSCTIKTAYFIDSDDGQQIDLITSKPVYFFPPRRFQMKFERTGGAQFGGGGAKIEGQRSFDNFLSF